MATAILSPNAKQQFLTDAGEPAAGYLLHTYAANTTTPQATYQDRAGLVPNANPIVLDARGEAIVYLTPGVVYDYKLTTPLGSTVWTREDIIGGEGAAAASTFLQIGDGAVTRTVQDKLRESISPQDYGAVGDGSTDDTAAFLAMAAAARAEKRRIAVPKPASAYRLTDTVNLRGIALDASAAVVSVDHAGIGLVLGGTAPSQTVENPDQHFGYITRVGGITATPTVQIRGTRHQVVRINRAEYIQLWADTSAGIRDTDYSIAYSTFDFAYVDKLELTNNPANTIPDSGDVGGAIQWINENVFNLNICHDVTIGGTYAHNHNVFNRGTFEGTSSITINKGTDNKFYGQRFEGGPTTITFAAGTDRNVVINTWASSESSGWPNNPIVSGTITNNGGAGNKVLDEQALYNTATIVTSGDITDAVLNNRVAAGSVTTRAPQLQRLVSVGSNGDIILSDYLPVVLGDYYLFTAEYANSGDTVLYRPVIYFFDKDGKAVANATGYAVGSLTLVSNNSISTGAGLNFAPTNTIYCRIADAAISGGAVFCRVGIRGSGGQLGNALARRLTVLNWSPTRTMNTIETAKDRDLGLPYMVSAIPTQGFAPLGFKCCHSLSTSIYHNQVAVDANLTAGAASSAASISVNTAPGVAVGDIVGVNMDNRDTHWTTVSSVSGTTIGLTAGLAGAAANGNRVVFNRWKTQSVTLS